MRDELKLGLNASQVLQRRYLLRDDRGDVVETPFGMFRRVAKFVAKAEKKQKRKFYEEKFFEIMKNLEFLPNSPTLMNAGTELGQLSACFVIDVEDSLVSIFDAVKTMALIQQSGGGTGFSFSKIRAEGSIVKSTKGVASGPVSFMKVFDVTTDVIKQGGRRRGANMGVLRVDHPDILQFIVAKDEGKFSNFNISVAVDDKFMEAVKRNREYWLVDHKKKKLKKLSAKDVFDLIATRAWRTGDPGILFMDTINKKHPLPDLIDATNPCGEQPLYYYESCDLGSINLSKMLKKNKEGMKIDWKKLEETVRLAVRFLDNVIDVNKYIANINQNFLGKIAGERRFPLS